MKLSVIICTYNRAKLLELCLKSLESQMNRYIEVLVVDNASNDQTKLIALQFQHTIFSLRYLYEPKVGLSNARNRGIREAKSDWVLFLDDDAIAFPDLIKRALDLIKMGNFACVGGMYHGYYEGKKPKWVSEDFGTKAMYADTLTECDFDVPHGGIVLYLKKSVENAGFFSDKYGMKGNKQAYSEETELQKRIQENGGKIMFDPELKIHHLVHPRKLTLKGRLIQEYALGKGHKYKHHDQLIIRILRCLRSFGGIFYRLFRYSFYLLRKKDFYWQNYIIDSFGPFLYYLGRV